jgi:hypothetical protein
LNNPHTHNPGSGDSHTPSNTTGFIYSTYWAAGTEGHRDKSPANGSEQRNAYLSSAVGGSVSTISFEDKEAREQVHTLHGGGIRGRIKGFSRVSRRNLLGRLASINRTVFRVFRRLARIGSSGPLRRLRVFIRYENVVRLLELLGYSIE